MFIGDCEDSTERLGYEFLSGESCYRLSHKTETWHGASSQCFNWKGTLLAIDTENQIDLHEINISVKSKFPGKVRKDVYVYMLY